MEELLLIFFGALLAIVEGVLEAFIYIPFDFGFDTLRSRHPRLVVFFTYLFLGLLFGWVSLASFPNQLLHTGHLRMANLFLAPVTAGIFGVLFAKYRRSSSPADPVEHFVAGFLFTLGFVIVRFVYVRN